VAVKQLNMEESGSKKLVEKQKQPKRTNRPKNSFAA
jgi:hypothetical protein